MLDFIRQYGSEIASWLFGVATGYSIKVVISNRSNKTVQKGITAGRDFVGRDVKR